MKVRIGSYDVEISATNEYLKDSDMDPTLSFLNELSSVFMDAGSWNVEMDIERWEITIRTSPAIFSQYVRKWII